MAKKQRKNKDELRKDELRDEELEDVNGGVYLIAGAIANAVEGNFTPSASGNRLYSTDAEALSSGMDALDSMKPGSKQLLQGNLGAMGLEALGKFKPKKNKK